jgi:glycerol-3-phosphate acyltransferase PlsY
MQFSTIDYIMIAIGYLAGSIPVGLIIFYFLKGDDVRKYGSKNIGATNVARNAGILPGVITLILDILKGFLPVAACAWISVTPGGWTIAFVAVAAIVGHMFPIWLLFRGGKGVATGLGVFLGLSWQVTLMALVMFILSFLAFKIVSLSSLVATASFVIFAYIFGTWLGIPLGIQIAALVAGILIFLKHYENIGRIIHGEEKKLFSREKKEAEQ